ncbi:MAG: cell division FtsA domain-containing protein [Candidatus Omnitrophica bacterium]|nr:cell division FtsA domain-containing protein [Candidatus Omnitrophota bacterium]
MFKNYICALDIGESKIAAAVVELRRNVPVSLFFESQSLKALDKGTVVESIELIRSVERVLESLKSKSGINIKGVYANISGQDIIVRHSHALVPLWDRRGKVVTGIDIQNVNEQALILGANLDEEILTYLPNEYSVDLEKQVVNPLGLFSHRLGVDLTMICGKAASVRSFYHVINRAGYDLKGLVFSGLATAEIILGRENKEGVNVLCDVGGDITEILILKNGIPKHIEIISTGGEDITGSLQEELKIPYELAEEIRKSYGTIGNGGGALRDKEILLKEGDMYKPIKQGVVIDTVTAQAQAICSRMKESVYKNVTGDEINNLFAAGRTMLQDGFIEMFEGAMGIPVRLGRITHPQIVPLLNHNPLAFSGHKYLTYLTSLGIICWVIRQHIPQFPAASSSRNPISKVINKVYELYQEYF